MKNKTVTVKFKDARTKESCVFYVKERLLPKTPFCKITIYDTCHPDSCPFYKSKKMLDESYEQARQNYIKANGTDKYYQLGYAKLKEEGANNDRTH